VFQGAAHGETQGVWIDGLGDVVEGAQFHRLDGALDSAESRHQDDDHFRIELADLAQQVDPGDAGHLQITNDQVLGRFLQQGQSLLAVGGGGDRIALLLQLHLGHPPQAFVVIDHQDSWLRHFVSSPGAKARQGPKGEMAVLARPIWIICMFG